MSSQSSGDGEYKYQPRTPQEDFLGEDFDPLLVLNKPNVPLPIPTARTFDNIAMYSSAKARLERPGASDSSSTQATPKIDKNKKNEDPAETIKRRFLPHQMPIKVERKKYNPKNVFTKMESSNGPAKQLSKWVSDKSRVKVVIRSDIRVRGYCIGTIILFDNYWNIVLEDVTEVWQRKRKRKAPALLGGQVQVLSKTSSPFPNVVVTNRTKKIEFCERHVDSLLVRGEQIVIVAEYNDPTT